MWPSVARERACPSLAQRSRRAPTVLPRRQGCRRKQSFDPCVALLEKPLTHAAVRSMLDSSRVCRGVKKGAAVGVPGERNWARPPRAARRRGDTFRELPCARILLRASCQPEKPRKRSRRADDCVCAMKPFLHFSFANAGHCLLSGTHTCACERLESRRVHTRSIIALGACSRVRVTPRRPTRGSRVFTSGTGIAAVIACTDARQTHVLAR